MVREDLIKVYACAESLWNTFKCEEDEIKAQMQDELWFMILKNYELGVIMTAMVEQAKVTDFCNIAKVARECELITEMQNNELVDDDEIFREIDRAIVASDKKKAFDELSDIAKQVVGNASQLFIWGQSDIDEFTTVITSNIKRSIRQNKETYNKQKSIVASSGGKMLLSQQEDIKKLLKG